MELLLVCTVQEVLDGSLGHAILEVGVNPTEGKLLPCIVTCLSESVVMKASVVAVIMQDSGTVFCQLLFKSKLGSKCFI